MRQGPFLVVSLLTGITYLACGGLSLSTNHGCIPHCTTADRSSRHHDNKMTSVTGNPFLDRRFIVKGILPTMVGLVSTPPTAQALQARNEILCGTGFFTNIAQYKCTEIGDISQDGKVQSLTSAEEGSIQSLLDKLGDDTTNNIANMKDGTDEKNDGTDSKLDKSQFDP